MTSNTDHTGDGKPIRRVLLVRMGSLGDILYALPALASLKRTFPHWELDWLVEKRWRPLLEGNPYLTRIIEADTLGWRRSPFSATAWAGLFQTARALRRRPYDFAVDLQGALKSALACHFSAARVVVGFERPWLREPGASVFYTRRVRPHAVHVIEANLALAASLGAAPAAPEFPLPAGDERELPPELRSESLAVVNPGAGWAAKQWSVESYAAVCDSLDQLYSLPVALNAGPGERELAERVRAACHRAQPQIYSGSLRGLIALMRRARIAIGPDTGPLHLAAALGVPTVSLFGPTDPRRNAPFGDRHRALRAANAVTSYSHTAERNGAMDQIRPSQVLEALQELLAVTPGCGNAVSHARI